MSQLYLVKVSVRLSGADEVTTVVVSASNADHAATMACTHCQISPTVAEAEVRRVKGNCYGVDQVVIPLKEPRQTNPVTHEPRNPQERDADAVQRLGDARPQLSKRVVELRATLYSRTDDAAYVGVGKALIERGKSGAWRSEYCELEQLACEDDEERRPNNPRVITNADYTGARVYRN